MIKIASFNTRGLQDAVKRRKVFKKFRESHYDVVMLQETHCTDKDAIFWKREWGGEVLFSHGTSASRGVATLFRRGLDLSVVQNIADTDGRYVIVEAKLDNFDCVLANV